MEERKKIHLLLTSAGVLRRGAQSSLVTDMDVEVVSQ